MISVILIWICILISSYAAGITAACILSRTTGYRPHDNIAVLLGGIVVLTVYAQVWSLFGGVGPAAVITMCLCLSACLIIGRGRIIPLTRRLIQKLTANRLSCMAVIALVLIMSYGASHGIMHYDTGLYHAQAIHWIESFGSVPGLANLHTRLGYNSSAFALNALFGFGYTGQSYHVTAAFCAFLLACECIVIPIETRRGFLNIPGMFRIAGLYYLFMIYDEMVSPASDYYLVCLAFILMIRWADTIRRIDLDPAAIARCGMLSVFAAFLVTVKLSGAVFILLCLIPAVRLIRSSRIKAVVTYLAMGTAVILPYLIRNVILSGWLLYPSVAFDITNADWKVPKTTAIYDYREIQVYGRGYTDVARFEEPVTSWFADWFSSQPATDRILIAAAIVGVLYFVIKCLYYVCLRIGGRRMPQTSSMIYTETVICTGFCFWLFTSPLMRYGCLYVYLCDAVIWGGLLCRLISGKRKIRVIVYAFLISLLCYKLGMTVIESIRIYRSDTWIRQQDYDGFEVSSYVLADEAGDAFLTVYYPTEGDRTGYEPFPSSPWRTDEDIELRGQNVKDGFRVRDAGQTRYP